MMKQKFDNFLNAQQINWKYILILVILAFLVGGGILIWMKKKEIKIPKEEIVEKVAEPITPLTPFYNEKEAKKIIKNRSTETILAIKNKDMEKLSLLIHPDKGIRFSPYPYVDLESDLIFTSAQIRNIFADKKRYVWGIYDGSGFPIKLTFEEYFKEFIYDQDFANAEEISYNRIITRGNTRNNILEVYPNAIIVEYYFPGFDPKYEGMDWKSLQLVFEEKDGVMYLVGIIHAQWTI